MSTTSANGRRPAVFLDRDGTINVPPPPGGYVLRPEDLHLVEGAASSLRSLADAGFALILVTNQRCVGTGKITAAELDAIHDRMNELLAAGGGPTFAREAIYAATDEDRAAPRRKPRPTMLLEAAHDHGIDLSRSWMVGDTDKDARAGLAAGVRVMLFEHPGTAEQRAPGAFAGEASEGRLWRVASLRAAAEVVAAAEANAGAERDQLTQSTNARHAGEASS